MAKQLIFMRGLPGSGKSTVAKNIKKAALRAGLSCIICSTDDYHLELVDNVWTYIYKPERLHWYHQQNLNAADTCMFFGVDVVIIDNTNKKWAEVKDYIPSAIRNGYEISFIDPTTEWAFDVDYLAIANSHQVSKESIEIMLRRWESLDSVLIKLNQFVVDYNSGADKDK